MLHLQGTSSKRWVTDGRVAEKDPVPLKHRENTATAANHNSEVWGIAQWL